MPCLGVEEWSRALQPYVCLNETETAQLNTDWLQFCTLNHESYTSLPDLMQAWEVSTGYAPLLARGSVFDCTSSGEHSIWDILFYMLLASIVGSPFLLVCILAVFMLHNIMSVGRYGGSAV